MDFFNLINYILQYLNGYSETMILVAAIFIDTIFATKSTKVQGNHTTSGRALDGLRLNLEMAVTPALITILGVVSSLIPYHNLNTNLTMFVFDIFAACSFVFIGNYFLKSILANYKLMGGDVPENMDLGKWLKGEVEQKYQKRSN